MKGFFKWINNESNLQSSVSSNQDLPRLSLFTVLLCLFSFLRMASFSATSRASYTHTHTEKTRTSTLWHVIVLWFDDLHLFYCNKEAAVRFAFTKQPVLLTVHERWMSLAGLQSLVLKHWAFWNWTRWARADLTNSSECWERRQVSPLITASCKPYFKVSPKNLIHTVSTSPSESSLSSCVW